MEILMRTFECFWILCQETIHDMFVCVPRVLGHLTTRRVLVTEWIDGRSPRDLGVGERRDLAQKATRCLAMQLMTRGLVHCDPHEGNLLAMPDGRMALLDFGMMAQMRADHVAAARSVQ